MILFLCLPSEIVIEDVFRRNAQVVEHVNDSGAHRAGTAHVVFDVLGSGMVFQIGVEHHLVHETCRIGDACRIGGGVGTVQGEVEMEVGEVALQLTEIVQIKDLVQGTGAIEVMHLAVSDVHGAGQVHDLCTERRHACPTANPYHFWEF